MNESDGRASSNYINCELRNAWWKSALRRVCCKNDNRFKLFYTSNSDNFDIVHSTFHVKSVFLESTSVSDWAQETGEKTFLRFHCSLACGLRFGCLLRGLGMCLVYQKAVTYGCRHGGVCDDIRVWVNDLRGTVCIHPDQDARSVIVSSVSDGRNRDFGEKRLKGDIEKLKENKMTQKISMA